MLLVPARIAKADDALPYCLQALDARKKEVTDLKARDQVRLQTIALCEKQRDEALKIPAPSHAVPFIGYLAAGLAGVGTGLACASGKTELCLGMLGATLGATGEILVLSW